MRVLLQRVLNSQVSIDNIVHSSIGHGLLILLGIEGDDTAEDLDWIVPKILQMRIFNDANGKMNKSILEVDGQLLIVSQFTLYASTKKGNRPSFIGAARPEVAIPIYHEFIERCSLKTETKSGVFGADMKVTLTNDGPVTIWLDSKNKE